MSDLTNRSQPMPAESEHPDVTHLVIADLDHRFGPGSAAVVLPGSDVPQLCQLVSDDLNKRNAVGIIKYGRPLQPFNGRSATLDMYQEALDLLKYTRQRLYELGQDAQHELLRLTFQGYYDRTLAFAIEIRAALLHEFGE